MKKGIKYLVSIIIAVMIFILATYYQLINLTDDPDIKDVLSFLGQREITHYQRFGEALMDVYDFTECKKIF